MRDVSIAGRKGEAVSLHWAKNRWKDGECRGNERVAKMSCVLCKHLKWNFSRLGGNAVCICIEGHWSSMQLTSMWVDKEEDSPTLLMRREFERAETCKDYKAYEVKTDAPE